MDNPTLWRVIDLPDAFCITEAPGVYGGDIRMGDLRNSGQADFLVYRSVENAHDEGGRKPCFLGAFTAAGEPISPRALQAKALRWIHC